jgi:hypothetical protein
LDPKCTFTGATSDKTPCKCQPHKFQTVNPQALKVPIVALIFLSCTSARKCGLIL